MPNTSKKFRKGFIDPLSLIALGFLVATLVVGVTVTTNPVKTFLIKSLARLDEGGGLSGSSTSSTSSKKTNDGDEEPADSGGSGGTTNLPYNDDPYGSQEDQQQLQEVYNSGGTTTTKKDEEEVVGGDGGTSVTTTSTGGYDLVDIINDTNDTLNNDRVGDVESDGTVHGFYTVTQADGTVKYYAIAANEGGPTGQDLAYINYNQADDAIKADIDILATYAGSVNSLSVIQIIKVNEICEATPGADCTDLTKFANDTISAYGQSPTIRDTSITLKDVVGEDVNFSGDQSLNQQVNEALDQKITQPESTENTTQIVVNTETLQNVQKLQEQQVTQPSQPTTYTSQNTFELDLYKKYASGEYPELKNFVIEYCKSLGGANCEADPTTYAVNKLNEAGIITAQLQPENAFVSQESQNLSNQIQTILNEINNPYKEPYVDFAADSKRMMENEQATNQLLNPSPIDQSLPTSYESILGNPLVTSGQVNVSFTEKSYASCEGLTGVVKIQCNNEKYQLEQGIQNSTVLNLAGVSNYVNAYSQPRQDSSAYIQNCINEGNPAYWCMKQGTSLSQQQVTSTVKLGTTLTAAGAGLAAGAGAVTSIASLVGTDVSLANIYAATNIYLGTSATAATASLPTWVTPLTSTLTTATLFGGATACVIDPDSLYCSLSRETVIMGYSMDPVGFSQMINQGGQILQNSVSSITNAYKLPINVYTAEAEYAAATLPSGTTVSLQASDDIIDVVANEAGVYIPQWGAVSSTVTAPEVTALTVSSPVRALALAPSITPITSNALTLNAILPTSIGVMMSQGLLTAPPVYNLAISVENAVNLTAPSYVGTGINDLAVEISNQPTTYSPTTAKEGSFAQGNIVDEGRMVFMDGAREPTQPLPPSSSTGTGIDTQRGSLLENAQMPFGGIAQTIANPITTAIEWAKYRFITSVAERGVTMVGAPEYKPVTIPNWLANLSSNLAKNETVSNAVQKVMMIGTGGSELPFVPTLPNPPKGQLDTGELPARTYEKADIFVENKEYFEKGLTVTRNDITPPTPVNDPYWNRFEWPGTYSSYSTNGPITHGEVVTKIQNPKSRVVVIRTGLVSQTDEVTHVGSSFVHQLILNSPDPDNLIVLVVNELGFYEAALRPETINKTTLSPQASVEFFNEFDKLMGGLPKDRTAIVAHSLAGERVIYDETFPNIVSVAPALNPKTDLAMFGLVNLNKLGGVLPDFIPGTKPLVNYLTFKITQITLGDQSGLGYPAQVLTHLGEYGNNPRPASILGQQLINPNTDLPIGTNLPANIRFVIPENDLLTSPKATMAWLERYAKNRGLPAPTVDDMVILQPGAGHTSVFTSSNEGKAVVDVAFEMIYPDYKTINIEGDNYVPLQTAFENRGERLPLLTQKLGEIQTEVASLKPKEIASIVYDTKYRDSLTGLINRTGFIDALELEVAYSVSTGTPLSIGFMDLRKFKAINDTLGHQKGDEALITFAGLLEQNIRSYDMAAALSVRYAGDEFLLILPETNQAQAEIIKQRILDALDTLKSQSLDDNLIQMINADIAVKQWKDGDSIESVLKDLDKEMYEAKRGSVVDLTQDAPAPALQPDDYVPSGMKKNINFDSREPSTTTLGNIETLLDKYPDPIKALTTRREELFADLGITSSKQIAGDPYENYIKEGESNIALSRQIEERRSNLLEDIAQSGSSGLGRFLQRGGLTDVEIVVKNTNGTINIARTVANAVVDASVRTAVNAISPFPIETIPGRGPGVFQRFEDLINFDKSVGDPELGSAPLPAQKAGGVKLGNIGIEGRPIELQNSIDTSFNELAADIPKSSSVGLHVTGYQSEGEPTNYFYGKTSAVEIVGTKVKTSNKPIKILDIGAAKGGFVSNVKTNYPSTDVYGLTAHDYRTTGNPLLGIDYRIGNAENISGIYPKNEFDLIFSKVTATHFKDPLGSISQMYDLLKPGGVLMVDHFEIPGITDSAESLYLFLKNSGYDVVMDFKLVENPNSTGIVIDSIESLIIKKGLEKLNLPIEYSGLNTDGETLYKLTIDLPENQLALPKEVEDLFNLHGKFGGDPIAHFEDAIRNSDFSNTALEAFETQYERTKFEQINRAINEGATQTELDELKNKQSKIEDAVHAYFEFKNEKLSSMAKEAQNYAKQVSTTTPKDSILGILELSPANYRDNAALTAMSQAISENASPKTANWFEVYLSDTSLRLRTKYQVDPVTRKPTIFLTSGDQMATDQQIEQLRNIAQTMSDTFNLPAKITGISNYKGVSTFSPTTTTPTLPTIPERGRGVVEKLENIFNWRGFKNGYDEFQFPFGKPTLDSPDPQVVDIQKNALVYAQKNLPNVSIINIRREDLIRELGTSYEDLGSTARVFTIKLEGGEEGVVRLFKVRYIENISSPSYVFDPMHQDYHPDFNSLFLRENIGAKVYSDIGVGPKYFDLADVNNGQMIGYITSKAPGNFIENMPSGTANQQTINDLINIHFKLTEAGYYPTETQYFIDKNGRVTMIDAGTVYSINEIRAIYKDDADSVILNELLKEADRLEKQISSPTSQTPPRGGRAETDKLLAEIGVKPNSGNSTGAKFTDATGKVIVGGGAVGLGIWQVYSMITPEENDGPINYYIDKTLDDYYNQVTKLLIRSAQEYAITQGKPLGEVWQKNPNKRPYTEIIQEGIDNYLANNPGAEVYYSPSPDALTYTDTAKVFYGNFDLVLKALLNDIFYNISAIGSSTKQVSIDINTYKQLGEYILSYNNENIGCAIDASKNQTYYSKDCGDNEILVYNVENESKTLIQLIDKQVERTGEPVSQAFIIKYFLEKNNGDLAQSLFDASNFQEAISRGRIYHEPVVQNYFGEDLTVYQIPDEHILWIRDHILDEYSPILPYSNVSISSEYLKGPCSESGDGETICELSPYYDFSLTGRVGEIYHTSSIVALLNFFPPELLSLLTSGEYVLYGKEHGLIKVAADVDLLSELDDLNTLLNSYNPDSP